jgi:hypothetical protein
MRNLPDNSKKDQITKGRGGLFSNAKEYSQDNRRAIQTDEHGCGKNKSGIRSTILGSRAGRWAQKRIRWPHILVLSITLLVVFAAVTPPIRARIFSILNLDGELDKGIKEEILDKRTEYSKVFKNDDGTLTTLIFATPIHYMDDNGQWQDLEGQIIDRHGAGAGFLVKFDKTPGFEFIAGKTRLRLEPQNVRQVTGKVEENQASYFDAYDATDLEYAVGASQLEGKILIKSKTASSSFSFKLLSNVPVPKLENSEVHFSDCYIVRPFARDAGGKTYPVSVELATLKDGQYLILNTKSDWLKEAKFPVVINTNIASTTTSGTGEDVYVSQDQAGANFSGQADLGTYDNITTKTRSYIRFDLSSIPKGSIISSASLQLYAQDALGGTVYLRKVTSDWDPDVINWNSQPLFEEIVDSKIVDSKASWYAWNVTRLAKDWCDGKMPNYGMVLLTGETGMSSGGLFCSSDFSSDIALRPKLVVNYVPDNTPPGSVIKEPQDNSYLRGSNYAIKGSANDDIGGSGLAKVQVSVDGGKTWEDAGGSDPWIYEWELPQDGTYVIKSRAIDEAGNIETPSIGVTVTIDNTMPNALIASPKGGNVKGILNITGAASDENFKSFKLEHGEGAAPEEWTQLGAVRLEPVLKGKLGDGYTYGLNNGVYAIRLIVEDKAGNVSTDMVVIDVLN